MVLHDNFDSATCWQLATTLLYNFLQLPTTCCSELQTENLKLQLLRIKLRNFQLKRALVCNFFWFQTEFEIKKSCSQSARRSRYCSHWKQKKGRLQLTLLVFETLRVEHLSSQIILLSEKKWTENSTRCFFYKNIQTDSSLKMFLVWTSFFQSSYPPHPQLYA